MALAVTELLPWKWDAKAKQWIQDTSPPVAAAAASQLLSTLSYNVWFQDARNPTTFDDKWLPRQRALLNVCRDADVDIFCFQEVTSPKDLRKGSFMELFLEEDWVQQAYWVSDVTGKFTFTTWYGVMIASRLPIKRLSFAPFQNSSMGRGLLVAHLNTPKGSEQIGIGSVHLESLNSAEKRLEQLKLSCGFLERSCQTGLLLGDFNVELDEKHNCAKHWESRGWRDIDPGKSSWFGWNWRPDHTLLRSRIYTGTSRIIGDQEYGGVTSGHDGPVKTPSDHFAVRSQFTKFVAADDPVASGGATAHEESGCSASSAQQWSLENTCATKEEEVALAQVFAGTDAPTEAVKMLNDDPSLWPNLLGRCYVWSSYKNGWYLMWSGAGAAELPETAGVQVWQEWSLEFTALTAPEAVKHSLVFKGTQAPTDAVKMLNSDRTLWPNLRGECYVWSAYKQSWYLMWPGRP